jgi:hypothetical protein
LPRSRQSRIRNIVVKSDASHRQQIQPQRRAILALPVNFALSPARAFRDSASNCRSEIAFIAEKPHDSVVIKRIVAGVRFIDLLK